MRLIIFLLVTHISTHPVAAGGKSSFFDLYLEINLAKDSASAGKENKRIMIMYVKNGCSPCAHMKAKTFSNKEVKTFFKKNFFIYEVNIFGDLPITDTAGRTWTEKTYAKNRDIWVTPVFHFFNSKGKLMQKHVGFLGKDRFLALGRYVTTRNISQPGFTKVPVNRD